MVVLKAKLSHVQAAKITKLFEVRLTKWKIRNIRFTIMSILVDNLEPVWMEDWQLAYEGTIQKARTG